MTPDDDPPITLSATVIGGRHRVVRPLCHGGMSTVFEAEDLRSGRRVALKVIHPEASLAAEERRGFACEAQMASRMAHPHIAAVLDAGEDEALGLSYIALELVEGRDLRAHLQDVGRLPARDALALMVPVMEALAAAHDHGVVHCDVKPENIVLAETPRGVWPKLIDFGIAKVTDEAHGERPREAPRHGVVGTPCYMAPEQVNADDALDGRVDVWAVGVVLYEMLSGVRPFTAESPYAVLAKVLFEDPTPLADLAPYVPEDVAWAVMTALERDPAERHPTMRAFCDTLAGCAVMRTSRSAPPRSRTRPYGAWSLVAALSVAAVLVANSAGCGATGDATRRERATSNAPPATTGLARLCPGALAEYLPAALARR